MDSKWYSGSTFLELRSRRKWRKMPVTGWGWWKQASIMNDMLSDWLRWNHGIAAFRRHWFSSILFASFSERPNICRMCVHAHEQYRTNTDIYLYDKIYILICSETTLSLLMSLHLIHLANQDSLLRHKPIKCVLHELISSCFLYSWKYNISFFICLSHWKGKYFGCFVLFCFFTNY